MGSFVAPLLARGYRVVWFDQPGHGDSGHGRVALPDFVRAVEALAATHGPFTAAIGHSLGAASLGLALRRGLALERVVFLSSPASIDEHARNFARLLGITPRIRECAVASNGVTACASPKSIASTSWRSSECPRCSSMTTTIPRCRSSTPCASRAIFPERA